jgi:hypothetical protein
MQPAVHLRPDRLREHSSVAAELSATLEAALGRRPTPLFELDALDTTARRAVRALAELGSALAVAADAAESAERDAVRALHRAGPS